MFSIIIPVYNVENYLRACLDSVMNQTYSDYEVICVNDGSMDNSLLILEEYSSKSDKIHIIDQLNNGLSVSRNIGIQKARGEYILFLDSDDWIEPNTLKILSEKQNGEDLVCFNGRRFFEDGTTEEPDTGIEENNLTGWEYYNKYALVSRKFHFVCTVLRIYRKDFLFQHKLFFEEGILHEDNLFTPIACYYAKVVKVITDCLYVYRIRQGSITFKRNLKNLKDLIHIANMLSDFFVPIKDIDKKQIYREIAGEYMIYMTEKSNIFGLKYKEIIQLINWMSFKEVCIYPRHKRLFFLLNIHPLLFRSYLFLERKAKQLKN